MTDRMTNAEIVALCEAFDKASKPDSLMVAFAPAMFAKALTAIRQLQQPWQGIESAKDAGDADVLISYKIKGCSEHDIADVAVAHFQVWQARDAFAATWVGSDGTIYPSAYAWQPMPEPAPLPHAPEPGQ